MSTTHENAESAWAMPRPAGKALTRLRWFFVLLIPFLFLHLWFAMKVEEPFPSVLMLVFGGVDGTDGNYYSMVHEIRSYELGQSQSFTRDELLFDMEFPIRYHAMEHTFGPKAEDWKFSDPELKDWLKKRVYSITGQERPDSVVILWNKQVFQVVDGVSSREEETIAKFKINF